MSVRSAWVALVAAVLFMPLAPAYAGDRNGKMERSLPGMSLYNMTSLWTTQDGKEVRLDSLQGNPVVIAMIYLNCPDVCPLIAVNMKEIEEGIPKQLRPSVRFALFTFDPVRDAPPKLKAYARALDLEPEQWTLFHGDESGVRELAAALDVSYRRKDDGNFDHSVAITLLNADGVVVYRQVGVSRTTKEFVSEIEKLRDTGGNFSRHHR